MENARGFTLMEMLTVIAIIGILVLVAIPTYRDYTRRAHYTEVVEATAPYKASVTECYQNMGQLQACDSDKNGVLKAKYESSGLVKSIVVKAGKITVVPKKRFGITPKDTYILTPTVEHGKITWITSGGGVEEGYAN